MRLPRPIDPATQARVSTEGRRCPNPPSLQSPSVISASLFVRGLCGFSFISRDCCECDPASADFLDDLLCRGGPYERLGIVVVTDAISRFDRGYLRALMRCSSISCCSSTKPEALAVEIRRRVEVLVHAGVGQEIGACLAVVERWLLELGHARRDQRLLDFGVGAEGGGALLEDEVHPHV